MELIPLYRFRREDGGVTDSLTKPEGVDHTERVRIVAAPGKIIVHDNQEPCTVIDADSIEGWTEKDAPEETEEIAEDDDEIHASDE